MDNPKSILQLRILVLTLGESHHFGWWKSQFLSPTGTSFLERIYPKTKFSAAIRSATRAAMEVHDGNIGKGEVFHLFRLSRYLERSVENILKERSMDLESSFHPILNNQSELLAKLQVLTGGISIESGIGPIQVNGDNKNFVQDFAAIYQYGFTQNKPVFPYIEEET